MLFSFQACAHNGKYDKHGGHFDRKKNEYHCHTESCFVQHKQSADAVIEADKAGRAYSKTYQRSDWQHWSDLDHDCQNTRAEILIASSQVEVSFSDGDICHKVIHGKWVDPYTNKIFTNAYEMDIDHRIALAEAHRYGAAEWSKDKKEQFANDSLNLVAVDAPINKDKSDKGASQWMPPNINYWCEYIVIRDTVVEKYGLEFPQKEKNVNANIRQNYCKK